MAEPSLQAVHYHLNEYESNEPPICVGVCDFGELSQDAACRHEFGRTDSNGKVHRYTADEGDAGSGPTVLDPFHTHFLMTDRVGAGDGEADANAKTVRSSFEKYVSSKDVSGDGIQTPKVRSRGPHTAPAALTKSPTCASPNGRETVLCALGVMTLLVPPRVRLSKVVLVIAGGLQTFRDVRDALDPTDISTGTSVPVRDHKPPLRAQPISAFLCSSCVLSVASAPYTADPSRCQAPPSDATWPLSPLA